MHVQHLGILLRVHRRHQWLPAIFRQIRYELVNPRRRGHLVIMMDRPSFEVISAVNKWLHSCPPRIETTVIDCPEPIRTSEGCRWTETLQFMYAYLRDDGRTQAAMLWDDDLIFSDRALEELKSHLRDLRFDRVEADYLHLLDPNGERHDIGFLNHRATVLFRCIPGDDWSDVLTKRVTGGGTHSPYQVARSASVSLLEGKVLHLGYCSPQARAEAWQGAKTSGQLCAFFRQLAKEPQPVPCEGPDQTSRYLTMPLHPTKGYSRC